MENKGTAAGGGIGMCGILFIVFLILKLCNVINWSWWWVTAPLWIPAAIGILVLIIALIVMLIVKIRLHCAEKKFRVRRK